LLGADIFRAGGLKAIPDHLIHILEPGSMKCILRWLGPDEEPVPHAIMLRQLDEKEL